jgi:hypothetical protein
MVAAEVEAPRAFGVNIPARQQPIDGFSAKKFHHHFELHNATMAN